MHAHEAWIGLNIRVDITVITKIRRDPGLSTKDRLIRSTIYSITKYPNSKNNRADVESTFRRYSWRRLDFVSMSTWVFFFISIEWHHKA